jgi:hypothetical protein
MAPVLKDFDLLPQESLFVKRDRQSFNKYVTVRGVLSYRVPRPIGIERRVECTRFADARNRGGDAEHSRANLPAVMRQSGCKPGRRGRVGMLEIVWRNPRPPARRNLRVAEVQADESTSARMWVISYRTVLESGWHENEYQLHVNRDFEPDIAVWL